MSRQSTSSRRAEWRAAVSSRLNELDHLPTGWDGYGGRPVSKENAAFASKLLESVCPADIPAPQIVPGSDGDLQIEWHTLDGDIELHVTRADHVHAWRALAGGDPRGEEIELAGDYAIVGKWIAELLGAPLATSTAAE